MFSEDLTVFINSSTPGYKSATVAAVSFDVLYDNGFLLSGSNIEGADAQVTCIGSQVSTVIHGTALTVNSTSYRVCGIEPDGFGLTVLRLEKI